jgi:putative transcriptional regulator
MKRNDALIKARKEKKLTQSALAELMECQKTTISNWENGYAKPKLSDAFKLSEILNKKIDDIFFKDEVQESQTKSGTA